MTATLRATLNDLEHQLAEEKPWNAARLIPTSGISGADEQERRGTSALLAVMSSVREYGRAVTMPFGAPAGAMETFIEVPFDLGCRHWRRERGEWPSRGRARGSES